MFAGPLGLILSPAERLRNAWSDGSRSRSLILGLPAVLIAVAALFAILYAKFGSTNLLEESYNARLKETSNQGKLLSEQLRQDQAAKRATLSRTQKFEYKIPEPIKEQVDTLKEERTIYLQKLISLKPDEPKYRFQLAAARMADGDQPGALSILEEIAPVETPGYAPAHLTLAQYAMSHKANNRLELYGNIELALKHIQRGLSRDPDNRKLKELWVGALRSKGSLGQAYDVATELFEENPAIYKLLLTFNEQLGRTERDAQILNSAVSKYQEVLRTPETRNNNRLWDESWRGMVDALVQQNQFDEAEGLLKKEIASYSSTTDGAARAIHLQPMLASLYSAWAASIRQTQSGETDKATVQMLMLEKLKVAYQLNPTDENVLQSLSILALSDIENVSLATRKIYDPENHVQAPSVVLNQLGSNALGKKDYENAISFFERALDKDPSEPTIRNNLAYAYLSAERRNAERALKLVDEAMVSLKRRSVDPAVLSRYRHTRGTALMQLDRLSEAIAEFETTLATRPNHVLTLRALLECYQGSDLEPPSTYLRRLRAAEQSQPQSNHRSVPNSDPHSPSSAIPGTST